MDMSLTSRENACCFTGHRRIASGLLADVSDRLKETVGSLYSEGIRLFYAGGALGFDSIAAETVIQFRADHPDARLVLAIPCRNQTLHWKKRDIDRYQEIWNAANDVNVLSEEYDSECMQRRNRYMVDHSAVCVCYLKRKWGGTFSVVRYAENQGLRVINIVDTPSL